MSDINDAAPAGADTGAQLDALYGEGASSADEAKPEPAASDEAEPASSDGDGVPPAESEPEGPEANDDADDDDSDDGAPSEPVKLPPSWPAEQADAFAKLPAETQAFLTKREAEREAFVTAKAREVETTRQQYEQALPQAVANQLSGYAEQMQAIAQAFEIAPPDPSMLDNPATRDEYYRQDAAFRTLTAQREQAQLLALQAQREAETWEAQHEQRVVAEEAAMLAERLPEWSDPTSRQALFDQLGKVGAELGYGPEQLAQVRAPDILALNTALKWKRDSEKLAEINARKMERVRAAKQAPKSMAPGSGTTAQPQAKDPLDVLYPD